MPHKPRRCFAGAEHHADDRSSRSLGEEVVDSTEAAANFMERRDGDAFDIEAAIVIRLLREAETPQAIAAASEAFRDWADGLGLLDEATPDAEL